MIKSLMFPVVIGLTALITSPSHAEDKNYVQLSTGYSFAKSTGADVKGKKPKKGKVHSIELGRSVTDRVKIGLEFSHRSGYSVSDHLDEYGYGIKLESQSEKSSYKSSAAMMNVRCDVANLSGFTPYVVVGAGVSQNKMKDDFYRMIHTDHESSDSIRSNKSNNFAYKVGAGVSYSVTQKIGIDVRYQFVNLGKVRIHESRDSQGELLAAARGKLKTKEVLVGISYKF